MSGKPDSIGNVLWGQVETLGRMAFVAISILIVTGCSSINRATGTNPNPPIVSGFGTLDSSKAEYYDSVVIIFPDVQGSPGSGSLLAGIVTSSVLAAGITVIERTDLQKLLDEQRIQLQHADESAKLIRVGKIAGAKAVIVGNIMEWKQQTIGGRDLPPENYTIG